MAFGRKHNYSSDNIINNYDNILFIEDIEDDNWHDELDDTLLSGIRNRIKRGRFSDIGFDDE